MPLQPARREEHVFGDAGVELHHSVPEQPRSHNLCLVIALDEVTLVAKVGSLGLDLGDSLEQIRGPLVPNIGQAGLGRPLRSNLTPARSISGLGVGSGASAGGVLLGQ
jgi:hypothetical protein